MTIRHHKIRYGHLEQVQYKHRVLEGREYARRHYLYSSPVGLVYLDLFEQEDRSWQTMLITARAGRHFRQWLVDAIQPADRELCRYARRFLEECIQQSTSF